MNNNIGEKIRRVREMKGYSQDYMAHEMNITQSAYGKMESGGVKITIDKLEKISSILEIDIFNLLNPGHNIFNLYDNTTANGYIENQYVEMKDVYDKIITDKDEEISFLRKLLEKK